MWICKKCKYKNGNSSKTCHWIDCDGLKQDRIILKSEPKVIKIKPKKRVYDYCEACKKDMFFTETKWKGKKGYWRCESGKHRACVLKGETKPFPVELITNE